MTAQLQSHPATRVACADCVHFRRYPYGDGTTWKRKTGCYHPDLMEQKQSDVFLEEQQVPGDHEKLNLRGDCEKFEARPAQASWLQRVLTVVFS